jgi:hypothetical protein
MKLMRIEGDRIAEIVEVAGTVTDLVTPAVPAVIDETGAVIEPGRAAVYTERPTTAADCFHPDAGFVPHAPGAEVGFERSGNGWAPPPPPPPPSIKERQAAARAECARRITARASANTQANMTAYATVLTAKAPPGAADKADLAAFAQAIAWVGQMRARWPEIAAQELDPADDANWPEPSAAASAFAARF